MRRSVTLLLGIVYLASTVLAQTTFSRRSYANLGGPLMSGDFNRDGKPDLVGSDGNGIRVLLNNGDGTFSRPVVTAQSAAHGLRATIDFNRDGRTDLAGCTSEFTIWNGTGAGTFGPPRRFSSPGERGAMATEDFNLDDKPDVAVIWSTFNPDGPPNNGITVFFGDGAGGVSHSVTTDQISVTGGDGQCSFQDVVAGNYDGTGHRDVVIAANCPADGSLTAIVFGRGAGTGHFGFSNTDEVFRSLDIARDDVNQNGGLDLVASTTLSGPHDSNATGLAFYINNNASGTPAWEERKAVEHGGETDNGCFHSVRSGLAGDFNGDGIKDAAFGEVLRPADCSREDHRLAIKLGRADGTYGASQRFTLATELSRVVSGDFDRDGRLDLAVARGNATEVFLNRTNIATCPANSTLRTVKICAPTTVSGNTLHVRANTTSGGPITGMKVYVDNTEAFSTPNDTINKKMTIPSGSHRITVRAWDGQGSFSSVITVNAGGTSSCATPSTNRSINICSPVNESTVSNPVRMTAAVRTSNTYHGAKVYIDGHPKHTTTSKQVNTSFTLAPGRHRISVQAYDTQGAFTKTVFVNVR